MLGTVSQHKRGILASVVLVAALVVIATVMLHTGDSDPLAAPEFVVTRTVSDVTIGSMTGSCETITRSRVGDDAVAVILTGCVVRSVISLDLQTLLNQASADRMRRLSAQ